MSAVLMADELPMDVGGAEAVLSNHLEHKAEMDARLKSFTAFRDGQRDGQRASGCWTLCQPRCEGMNTWAQQL